MSTATPDFDVVILGSGMSSLTAAALLAKRGKRVCVLEQHTKPGGYLHCFSRFGERFDTGAHYVGAMEPGQPFHTILSYLGVDPLDYFTPLDPTGFDVLSFPELELALPKGYAETIARLTAVFPSEARAIAAYYGKVRETAAQFPTYEFHEEYDAAAVMRSLEQSLASVVEGLTENLLLRSVLYSYCALHAVKPPDVAFGLHALVTDSLVRGPYGFSRGGDALASRLVEIIRAAGGTVHLRKRVVAIENTGKQVTAVRTQDGESFSASWFISGIHPKPTFGLLADPSPLSPAFRARLASIPESPGIFAVYATFQTHPDLDPRRNYYYFDSSRSETMFADSELGRPPGAAFISPACRLGEGANSPFVATICALAPRDFLTQWESTRFGKRPEEYEEMKARFTRDTLDLIDAHRPSFSARIAKQVTSTPVTNLHFNGSAEGSSYGIYHSIAHTGARALGPRTHLTNLLLTGQNCLFPGLLGAAVSALRTAGHLVGIKPMLSELRALQDRAGGIAGGDIDGRSLAMDAAR